MLDTYRAPQDSWLSLVAETAGVADCSVARVELVGAPFGVRGDVRIVVQVLGAGGLVLGATTWEGNARELARGVFVDLGTSGATGGERVVAWVDAKASQNNVFDDIDPFFLAAPRGATRAQLDEHRNAALFFGVVHLAA